MDFFTLQDQARQNTWKLILVFSMGVLLTIVLVNLLGYLCWGVFGLPWLLTQSIMPLTTWFQSEFSWYLSLGALFVIIGGSLKSFLDLREGGQIVAQWAGGQLVDWDTAETGHKQLINVVDEMSIASGVSRPELYVIPENSINAFVAGYQPDDAVLAVTQGALDHLSRDELQGVIAHEYSHILNGDMRLNIRLLSVLSGLVAISQWGRSMLSVDFRLSHSGPSLFSFNKKKKFSFSIFGVGLIAVGYVGSLAARIIKAAVSRQREFLADASSVQFTRNPDGIAGALYQIEQHKQGALLHNSHAEDLSHLCFATPLKLSDTLATHPPFKERIRRVNPNFFVRAKHKKRREETLGEALAKSQPSSISNIIDGAAVMTMAGQVTPTHLDYARQLYQHIPIQVKDLVHQSMGAKAYCYGQVMLDSPSHRQAILDILKQEDPEVLAALKQLWPFVQKLDAPLRLPILDMAISVLKRLDPDSCLEFLARIERLIQLDQSETLTEWLLATQLRHHLQPTRKKNVRQAITPFKQCYQEVSVLLAALVYQSTHLPRAAEVYQSTIKRFGIAQPLVDKTKANFTAISAALKKLENISYFWREIVLQAAVDILKSDDELSASDYELIRTLANTLGCPMPLLIEHQYLVE